MAERIGKTLFTVMILMSISACVAHFRRDPQPAEGYEYRAPTRALPALEYTPAGPVELEAPTESRRYHDALPLSFPSSGSNGHESNRVEGVYLRSRGPGAKKLVIVLPIWGASTYPPKKVSYGYARHSRGDAHVIWLFGEPPLFPWVTLWSTPDEEEWVRITEDAIERYRTAVVDTRRLLDWVGGREEIDADRVAIVGFSMGALAAATIMGNDARISAGVMMMGGANFADVMAECRGKAGRMREHALQSFGWTHQDYREYFRQRMGPADPVNYSGRYNPDQILIIDARFDNCIPHSAREALWETTGFPERITMLYRHKGAFYSLTPLGFNFARGTIYRFLDRAL